MPADDKIDIKKKDVAGGVKLSEEPTGQGNGENLDIKNLTASGDGAEAKKTAKGIEVNLELPPDEEPAQSTLPRARRREEPTSTGAASEQPTEQLTAPPLVENQEDVASSIASNRQKNRRAADESPPQSSPLLRRGGANSLALPTDRQAPAEQKEDGEPSPLRRGTEGEVLGSQAPTTEETPLVPQEYGRPIPSAMPTGRQAPGEETETTAEEQPSEADRARLPQGGQQAAAAGLASQQAQDRFRAGSDAMAKVLVDAQSTLNSLEKEKKQILKKETAIQLAKTAAKLAITSVLVLTILWYLLKIFYYLVGYKGGKKTKAVTAKIEKQKRKIANIRKKIGRSQQIRQRTAQLAASVRRG